MKKLTLTFAMAVLTSIAFAQGITFGIKGGLNFSTLNYDPHTDAMETGFNAGAIADIGLHNWSFQPGLFFTTKGEVIKDDEVLINNNPAGTVTTHIRLDYIQLPANFLYHIKAAPLLSFYLGGGPYFAYGVSGTVTDGQVSDHINFNSKPDAFQPLTFKNPDIGLGLLAGVQIAKKLMADIGYDTGFTNIGNGGATIENHAIRISVGYLFR